jgi:hypothetical protein
MSKSIITTQRGHSGSPWRIIPKEAQIGEVCTVTTSDTIFGDVVHATPGSVTTDIGGEDSFMLTVTKAVTGADDNVRAAGFFGVVQQVDGINATAKGAVEFGPATLLVNVHTTSTSDIAAGTPLYVNFTTDNGTLGVHEAGTDSHKIVAVTARAYTGLADNTTYQMWVHFDGIYGFGSRDAGN